MDYWRTRKSAEAALRGPLLPEQDLLDAAFALVDRCLVALEKHRHLVDPFPRITGLVGLKAKLLAFGCYTLALDGLSQEAGALGRPLLEALELLHYLAADPARAEAVLGKKPTAGEIAKSIGSAFQPFRTAFSESASHLSLSPHALRHLLDSTLNLRLWQDYNEKVLRTNLHIVLPLVIRLADELSSCLARHDLAEAEAIARSVLALNEHFTQLRSAVPSNALSAKGG